MWHVTVLAVTLVAAAALAVLALAPLVFETVPAGIKKARPWVLAAAVLAVALLVVEWRGVHGG